nr:hypothetical protein [Yoonia sp.]
MLGVLLTILPFGTVFGVKLLSFLAAVLLVALLTFLLGFTRPELRRGLRFVLLGTVLIYDFALRLMGRGPLFRRRARMWRQRLCKPVVRKAGCLPIRR